MAATPTSTPKKSILKTSIPSVHALSTSRSESDVPESIRKKSRDPRHLAIALHHARHIQARKDTEALILSHIEKLMELPSSPGRDAATPSSEDVALFKSALLPFQPSDYDNLILERNIDGRCGYTLCPKAHRKENPKAKFRILWGPKGSGPGGRGKEMRIVPKEKLEMWCSDECAERAMYIRVQLSETPAGERTEAANIDIKLLDETRRLQKERVEAKRIDYGARNPGELAAQLDTLAVDEKAPAIIRDRQLALERGDMVSGFGHKPTNIDVHVLEKQPSGSAKVDPPTPDVHTAKGGSIEGYRPKSHSHENGDEDMLPSI
ncbi:hypothetical protein VTO42DRAFT_7257 [Malbranchea cinnamomea]